MNTVPDGYRGTDAISSRMTLTSDRLEGYRQDGFLIVRSLYGHDEMATWKRLATDARDASGPGTPEDVTVWMAPQVPLFLRDRMAEVSIVSVLRQLVGNNIEFLSAKAVVKDRRITYASPWHRDWEYWRGTEKISAWVALDDARPENGGLRVIPGSHRRSFEIRFHEKASTFNHRIDDDQLADLTVVDVELGRGDVLFFSDRTVHGSHPNTSGDDRWSFIATYRDAGVVDDSNVWETAWVLAGQSVNVPGHRGKV